MKAVQVLIVVLGVFSWIRAVPVQSKITKKVPVSMGVYGSKHTNSPTGNSLVASCPSNWKAPWQAGLMILTSHKKTALCGGVLLHERWVLTSAHCVHNTTKILVMVGSKDYYGGFLNGKGQAIRVKNATIHENYRPGYNLQPPKHDIALLRLESDVVFGSNVAAALIPKRHCPLLQTNTEMVVAGWGITEKSRTTQQQLRCARVPLVSNAVCKRAYKRLGTTIRKSHVCTGYPGGGAGPCNGDAGGGLVHLASDGSNTVVGIISWSLGCGQHYSVYTSVQKHRQWLFSKAPELAGK